MALIENKTKRKLANNELALGFGVTHLRTGATAMIAAAADHDWLFIDMEHGAFSVQEATQLCFAALPTGITPIVRICAGALDEGTRCLDNGALGVIVPHVRSADEARRVVGAAKFAPLGNRSPLGGLPHLHYRSFPVQEATRAMNDATMVVVMMETLEALERVEEIAAVDGLDMLFIGTNDLTTEMGEMGNFGHPRVREAYERTIAACQKNGKHVGIGGLTSRPDLIAEYVRMGARFVSTGTDLAFLMGACAQRAREVREIKL